MSQINKLIKRLLSEPSDFTWKELLKLMASLGYEEFQSGKTSGSRVRFIHDIHEPVILHKPHPKPVLKRYQVKQILTMLKNRRQL